MTQRQVTVIYRQRDGYWEAFSPEAPDLVAGDASLAEVKVLAHAALHHVIPGKLSIIDVVEESAGIG